MKTNFDFDVIVIGSGFGGSVMTLRLAEKGHRVCLLERGRQYGMYEFPRQMNDIRSSLFWDPEDADYGFMEFDAFPKSDAFSVRASGLGGGSLIYANVLYRMPANFFQEWPAGISREELDPFYSLVEETMEANPYPFETDEYYAQTPKAKMLKECIDKLEPSPDATIPPRFVFPPLAVRFKGDFPGHQTLNNHGVIQSRCTRCGECDVGCNIHAKNTLDLNYIARARNASLLGPLCKPAEIRTWAEVTEIRPYAGAQGNADGGGSSTPPGGYQVTYRDPRKEESYVLTAHRVVLAAGSVGSTALMLKMKKRGLLPRISPMLGERWCANGDLEGTVLGTKEEAVPTSGPVITGAIEYQYTPYHDTFPHGIFIQDAGLPTFVAWYAIGKLSLPGTLLRTGRFIVRTAHKWFRRIFSLRFFHRFRREINIGNDIAYFIDRDDILRKSFWLLGMGRDINNGRILLSEDDQPIIKWKIKASKTHYDRVRHEMHKIAKAMGGTFIVNPLTYLNKIIAVHPIGGCVMADSEAEGVVDGNGEVFGHPGLYITDASILPTSVGPNPSLTIAAMAERIASRFPGAPKSS